MKNLLEEMLQLKEWAVIGASDKKDRYGYKIFKKLQQHNYEVYAINPGCEEIESIKCYKGLKELPKVVKCVNMVVNPKISMQVLDTINELKIKNVWFQPGSFNKDVINKANELKLNIINEHCILVELRKKENN